MIGHVLRHSNGLYYTKHRILQVSYKSSSSDSSESIQDCVWYHSCPSATFTLPVLPPIKETPPHRDDSTPTNILGITCRSFRVVQPRVRDNRAILSSLLDAARPEAYGAHGKSGKRIPDPCLLLRGSWPRYWVLRVRVSPATVVDPPIRTWVSLIVLGNIVFVVVFFRLRRMAVARGWGLVV